MEATFCCHRGLLTVRLQCAHTHPLGVSVAVWSSEALIVLHLRLVVVCVECSMHLSNYSFHSACMCLLHFPCEDTCGRVRHATLPSVGRGLPFTCCCVNDQLWCGHYSSFLFCEPPHTSCVQSSTLYTANIWKGANT